MVNLSKVFQAAFGLLLSVLLVMSIWQTSSAQAPGESVPLERTQPEVIVIPSTGYKPEPASKDSEKGRALFENLSCMSCHSIHSIGGDLGPMLDGVGGRRNDAFLTAHLSSSTEAQEEYKRILGAERANSVIHSRYSPETAKLLIAYLNTIPEPAGGFVVTPHVPRSQSETPPIVNKNFRPAESTAGSIEGQRLYNKFGCVACHAVGDVGGWFAPRLDGVGARRDRAYIAAHVTDAQAHVKELNKDSDEAVSRMARFTINDDQVQKITDYLLTLPRF